MCSVASANENTEREIHYEVMLVVLRAKGTLDNDSGAYQHHHLPLPVPPPPPVLGVWIRLTEKTRLCSDWSVHVARVLLTNHKAPLTQKSALMELKGWDCVLATT